ncbi:MAG: Loki-CTERM sorting domain-containing protein [Promethearchaeota archaeon]|jgi:hypothetical protein
MKKYNYIIFLMAIAICTNSFCFSLMSHSEVDPNSLGLKLSVQDITIITPENKTYTEPMSGYFPATYGFENDPNGLDPDDWTIFEGGGCSLNVIDSLGGHNKVIQLYDNGVGETNYAEINNSFSPRTSGVIEYWHRASSTEYSSFRILNDSIFAFQVATSGGNWQYHNGTWQTFKVASINQWYHVKLDINCTTSSYDIYIDGVLEVDDAEFFTNIPDFNHIEIFTRGWGISDYYFYIDAVSYSWDPNYNIGDNSEEGLLLSFENSSALDWMAYSLDGNTNKTIIGNTTISMPDDGSHDIQVFGNNSNGEVFESEIIMFEVDLNPPIININSPNVGQSFGGNAPDFDISITESNLNTTWYTLDSDITNITFTGLTGTINQTEWDKFSTEPIIIRFYANDTFGRESYTEITINKDINIPIITIDSPTSDQYFGSTAPSFALSITEPNLNTTRYTFDSGITNITFTELTGMINQGEWDKYTDGILTIRFYANDSFGNEDFAEITVNKDATDPILTINMPQSGEFFTELPPSYNISVTEDNLESMWYTIDGGITDIPFSSSTGFIDSTAWNNAPYGAITIRFYARDFAGNEVYLDVIVIKQSPSVPPGIPGYDLAILIGILSIISGIIIRKRQRK